MPSLSCFAHVQIGSQVSLVTSYQPPGPSPGSFRCQTLHPTQSDLGSQKSYNSFLTHHRPFSFHFPLLTSALIRAHRILPPFFIHNHGGSCRVNTRQGLPHPLDRREQPSPCSRDSQTHLAKPLASRAFPPPPTPPRMHCPCSWNKGGKPLGWHPPSSECWRAGLEEGSGGRTGG